MIKRALCMTKTALHMIEGSLRMIKRSFEYDGHVSLDY